MPKKKVYITIAVIFILVFFAGYLVYPFFKLPYIPQVPFKLGLDLQGGTHLIFEADLSKIKDAEKKDLMQGLKNVIERRVNYFGVREPVVQTQEASGQYRLIVELAGIKDPAEAIRMIGETPFLEFKEQKPNYDEIIANDKKVQETGSGNFEDPFQSTDLTGQYLQKSGIDFDQTTGKPSISIQFNDEGAKIFEELTERNAGKLLAISIDQIIISSPVVQEKISGGKAQITGNFSIDEAKTLVRNLNAGALPVPIKIISQETVGPILGKVSLEQSLKAGIIGFLGVILFMILFYRLPGVLAALALLIYVIFVLAMFKIVSVTLTLAGIAGFLLSIGMAVDANILIFARMKEELSLKKSLPTAIEEGFRRAWPSIRDSNFNSLIVCAILFSVAASFIKGFALTLGIGILGSMFSAIFITRNFLKLFMGTKIEKITWLWK
ncbi:MAG: protein translocase subunit SecD [bacterium]|nr:protein translocase subunit SecD [bacterium]